MEKSAVAQQKNLPVDEIERSLQAKKIHLFLKRSLDLLASFCALLLLTPLFIGIAIAIKLSSRGPIMFLQQRLGKNGRPFTVYKFRTMLIPEEWPEELKDGAQWEADGSHQKQKDDIRITRIGRVLRRFSFDELPQFLNVFIGNMSLVGPRPLMREMLDPFPVFCRARLLMKPGISGLWQIRNRSNCTSALHMLKDDVEYLQTFSFILDVKILLATLPVLLGDDNAY